MSDICTYYLLFGKVFKVTDKTWHDGTHVSLVQVVPELSPDSEGISGLHYFYSASTFILSVEFLEKNAKRLGDDISPLIKLLFLDEGDTHDPTQS